MIAWLGNFKSGSFAKGKKLIYTNSIKDHIVIMGFIKTVFLHSSYFESMIFHAKVLIPLVNLTLLLKLPENRISLPWKMISKVSYSFPDIYSTINQFSLSFSWSFLAYKLSFSSRRSCLKSWKIDFYFDYCILVFSMLQPGFIISSHPTSKSFPSIGPTNFQSPATPSYFLSQPMNTENQISSISDISLSFLRP